MRTSKGISPETGKPYAIEEHEELSSVELSVNAKGETSPTVKVYAEDVTDAASKAIDTLATVLGTLRKKGIPVSGDPKVS